MKASEISVGGRYMARTIGVDHSELYAIGRGAKRATRQMVKMLKGDKS